MRRWTAPALAAASILVLALAVPSTIPADEPEPKARENKASEAKSDEKAEKPVVITNEILEQRYGSGRGATVSSIERRGDDDPAAEDDAGATSPDAPVDALRALQDSQARERNRDLLIRRADAEIRALEARIAELERRELAIRNPFLPRPQVSEEEQPDWEGLDNEQRLQRTRQAIEQAKRDLDAVRDRRARLESIEG